MAPNLLSMHAIRKELLKKVLVTYIRQIPVNDDPEEEQGKADTSGYNNIINVEFDNINTFDERENLEEIVLENVDDMDTSMVFKFYQELVFDLKDSLKENDLIPEVDSEIM